ncbi:hypothetical protein [Pseudarthrobacter sp. NamE5]|uniref:hypothetical protein n=1 Tax=Pseudarthrobacter sp. NamE5 TaxID=2576839 RepID=UPI00110B8D42|nr:hypothetical protein [Pseudarthrobacter sp. NamE5]TLM87202.1 hypothetical protein FDW84_05240 [Pseudarthrobacter sp. NamE5]
MAGFTYLKDEEIAGDSRKPWQLLKDAVWALRSKTGNLLHAPIPRYGPDGKQHGETTPASVIGWLPEDIANIKWRLSKQQEQLDRIEAAVSPGKVDAK